MRLSDTNLAARRHGALLGCLAIAALLLAAMPSSGRGTSEPRAHAAQQPAVSVRVPATIRLKTLRFKGVPVRFNCIASCRLTGSLRIGPVSARRIGLAKGKAAVVIGSGKAARSRAGKSTMTLRLTTRARRAIARLKNNSTVQVNTSGRAGNARVAETRTIIVRR